MARAIIEVFVASSDYKYPGHWSRDGRFFLYRVLDNQTNWDLWTLPIQGEGRSMPFLKTHYDESSPRFSPNGRWVAYHSNEGGGDQVYVQSFPVSGGQWQISTNEGTEPLWRGDGRALYYLSADRKLMPVEINGAGSSFEAGAPRPLFEMRLSPLTESLKNYNVTSDGQRFLLNLPVERAVSPITVVVNWSATLRG